MFPKDAHFICRECLKPFAVPAKEFRSIAGSGELNCPKCNKNSNGRRIREFFKHYPRMANGIYAVYTEGFELTGIEYRDEGDYGFVLSNITFHCRDCGRKLVARLDSNYPDTTKLHCNMCGAITRVVIWKEFWASLKHVDNASCILNSWFQWNLFSPAGEDPFKFVHRRYSSGRVG